MSSNSLAIVHRIRQLIDLQIRTSMSALHAPSPSTIWRDYAAREVEISELFDRLEQTTTNLGFKNETFGNTPSN